MIGKAAMRLRLLPVLIVAASLGFVLKTGDIGLGLRALAPAEAATHGAGEADTAAPDQSQDTEAETPPGPDQAADTTLTAALPSDPFELTDEEIDLLQRLSERRAEIERRAAELEQRRTLLEAAEMRIDEKIAELDRLRQSLEALMIVRDEQEENQLLSLVKIYENMKPKDAARIFEELDMVVLLDVIERMKERKIAPILAQLNPQRAKTITIELAQRRGIPGASE